MSFHHRRENNTVKYNIVFPDKVHQIRLFALPVIFPVFTVFFCPFFGERNVANWCVEPYIKYFSFCARKRNRNSPIQISSHCTRFQTIVQPRFYLSVNIGFPIVFMSFNNPFIKEVFVFI